MATKKLILDLDMGVDDAMALAYAIASASSSRRTTAWRCSTCWVVPRCRCTWAPIVP